MSTRAFARRPSILVLSMVAGACMTGRALGPSTTADKGTGPVTSHGVVVLTQHNNNQRTGANLEESLTTESVRSGKFGLLFSRIVDGQIYAQPLYVSGVAFPDGSI